MISSRKTPSNTRSSPLPIRPVSFLTISWLAFIPGCECLDLESSEKDKVGKHLRTYPAIKLARMALDKSHQGAGLGTLIVEIIKGFAVDLNQKGVAIRFITVDAYPQKLGFYTNCGFVPNIKAKQTHTSA